jgi:hypothetical protein
MFNGSALKIAFLMIVFTMCVIVMSLVIGVIFFKFPVDDSKMMLGILGISGLFGVIIQSFVHANIADAIKTAPAGNAMSTQTTTEIKTVPTQEKKL